MGSFGASKWAYFGAPPEQYLGSFIIAQAGFGHMPSQKGLKKGVQNRGSQGPPREQQYEETLRYVDQTGAGSSQKGLKIGPILEGLLGPPGRPS